jgi:hypothetical protein
MRKFFTIKQLIPLTTGFLLVCLVSGLYSDPETTEMIVSTIQALVIICATLFTAWWTTETFGNDRKNKEAQKMSDLMLRLATDYNELCFYLGNPERKSRISEIRLRIAEQKIEYFGLKAINLYLPSEPKNFSDLLSRDELLNADQIENLATIARHYAIIVIFHAKFDIKNEMRKFWKWLRS